MIFVDFEVVELLRIVFIDSVHSRSTSVAFVVGLELSYSLVS